MFHYYLPNLTNQIFVFAWINDVSPTVCA